MMSKDAEKRLLLSLFAIGAAAMLLGALGDQERAYYILLRWVVCFAALQVALFGFQWGRIWAVGGFTFVAILFNPLFPIQMTSSMWSPIDVGVAALFLLAVLLVKAPSTSSATQPGWKRRSIILATALPLVAVAALIGTWVVLGLADQPTQPSGDRLRIVRRAPTPGGGFRVIRKPVGVAVAPTPTPIPLRLGTAYVRSGTGEVASYESVVSCSPETRWSNLAQGSRVTILAVASLCSPPWYQVQTSLGQVRWVEHGNLKQ